MPLGDEYDFELNTPDAGHSARLDRQKALGLAVKSCSSVRQGLKTGSGTAANETATALNVGARTQGLRALAKP